MLILILIFLCKTAVYDAVNQTLVSKPGFICVTSFCKK